MSFPVSLCAALAITLVLELIFAFAWGLRKHQLWIVILMNILTNPAANALYSFMTVYLGWPRLLPAVALEIAVVITEGLCCRGLIKKPWLFALFLNLFSYAAGLILQLS